METKTELKYQYYEDIKQCDLCNLWIEYKMYKREFNRKMMYFHPFCYRIVNGKKLSLS